MKINQVAQITGVTVRTLHYYDEIGLLKPKEILESGYRIYGREELSTLQQILFFRELKFPLSEIKEIINSPGFDRLEALEKHKELLVEKRSHLDKLIALVDETMKGSNKMSFKEFDMTEIEDHKKKYADEVKARWGGTDAYGESQAKTAAYGGEEWSMIKDEANDILKEFSEIKHLDPASEDPQLLVGKWQKHITDNFYNCTKEILASLGIMYCQDERFKGNIDSFGDGTADFMSKAIACYCNK